MASFARWTESEIAALATPIDVLAAASDRAIAARSRAVFQETTDLFDMARRQAVLRWRGLVPERRVQ